MASLLHASQHWLCLQDHTLLNSPATFLLSAVCLFFFLMCLQEEYLSDEDFKTHLGVDREAYQKLPEWKKLQLKKGKMLF
jgi:hypothetical protein